MSAKEQPGNAATVLTIIDVRALMSMAIVEPSQLVNTYGLTELKRIIYATERIQATLRCDDERAIKAVRRDPIQDIEGLTGRLAPTGSSQSQGFVEKWYQALVSQVRALRLAIFQNTTTPINKYSCNTSYHAVDREAFHMASQQTPHSR